MQLAGPAAASKHLWLHWHGLLERSRVQACVVSLHRARLTQPCYVRRKAYGSKARGRNSAAGVTAQVTTARSKTEKLADELSGSPALALNGLTEPTQRLPRPDVQTNGYH